MRTCNKTLKMLKYVLLNIQNDLKVQPKPTSLFFVTEKY